MHGLILRDPRGLSIGSRTNVNPDCIIDTRGGKVVIGDDCDISPQVNIWTLQHDISDPNFKSVGGDVVIDNFVHIGNRAIVLPGVTLGEGCVVAAGAVVTKSVAAYTVVAGIPAKQIGVRPRNQIARVPYKPMLL